MAAVIGNRNISLGVLGGTLITAACYSGGDVFGCSPYDAATTAYLKATYPSYWQAIRDYGYANPQAVPMIENCPDMAICCVQYEGFGAFALAQGITQVDIPLLAVDADDTKEQRTWLYSQTRAFSGWTTIEGLLAHNAWNYIKGGITPTNNYVSKVGTYNSAYKEGTLAKIFVPKTMPTGYSEWFADGFDLYVNGVHIIRNTSYHNNRKNVPFDFTDIIKLNEANFVCLEWWGSGTHGIDLGFY